MDAAAAGVAAQKRGPYEQRIHEQDIFDRVVLFLPPVRRTVGLFNRVLGADDASFRPVMGKRGRQRCG